jgi:hypothetical protein
MGKKVNLKPIIIYLDKAYSENTNNKYLIETRRAYGDYMKKKEHL